MHAESDLADSACKCGWLAPLECAIFETFIKDANRADWTVVCGSRSPNPPMRCGMVACAHLECKIDAYVERMLFEHQSAGRRAKVDDDIVWSKYFAGAGGQA